ncbi:hypothetical protein BYT27DRAFT_7191353 [Phlegmacium glaucopus]|nr:hypothetical protein BYT27DRAFT_7191353 [Phlegmacium glaucopus]
MAQFLSGQCYGFSKNFENFYPDRDMGSKGTFRGPHYTRVPNCEIEEQALIISRIPVARSHRLSVP